eukprot:TRINITY_DN1920_c0_g2_i1.p1 TRINITY_DN1920_c0_g2~~TRINITY_DN1920_c0_g2_i1.p1  ORF type:complete len:329 (+),score=152.60 TRINITY_DN1920_c0_g2_i1:71-1057(+)
MENNSTIINTDPCHLPKNVFLKIISFLDQETFLKIVLVSKKWNSFISQNIDELCTFFEESEIESENEENEENEKIDNDNFKIENMKQIDKFYKNENGEQYTDEQLMFVEQINSFNKEQYCEMLGVNRDSKGEISEEELRSQYKKLSLMVHPDKNKAPGATTAFDTLKKAYEALLKGEDKLLLSSLSSNNSNIRINCVNNNCLIELNFKKSTYELFDQGKLALICNKCNQEFSKVFCFHCFSCWIISFDRKQANEIRQCSNCFKNFALQFPNSFTNYEILEKKKLEQQLQQQKMQEQSKQQFEQQKLERKYIQQGKSFDQPPKRSRWWK